MKKRNLFLGAALALSPLCTSPVRAQASPYRGLWVGEIKLNGVNEVAVPLDANNIPRDPNPAVTTPTFDAANLRLILHVNGSGQVNLLKEVAILSRKAGALQSENDLALVTDDRLYGSFPPQPAQRIASVVFDFGDAQATAAVEEVVNAAADAAASSVFVSAAGTVPTDLGPATTAARTAAQAKISTADAAARFATFLRDVMNTGAVTAVANGTAVTAAQNNAATALKTGSFYGDARGELMIAAITQAIASQPTGATAAQKNKAAQNAASNFADVSNNYQRFLAGELFGDMISAAAAAVATPAMAAPRKTITAINGTTAAEFTTTNHQLATGDKISVSGAPITAYNGVFTVARVDANKFTVPVAVVSGQVITQYVATQQLAPVTVVSAGHGLVTGARITISGAGTAAYNGEFNVTVMDADTFSIPATYTDDPATHGNWAQQGGAIAGYEAAPAGGSGVKVTSANHGLNNGAVIVIEGAGAAVYNGARTITRVDANSFTIPVAFGGDPALKGTWSVKYPISAFQGPAQKTTTITSANHGLTTGDQIVITGAGNALYNSTFTVRKISASEFEIPALFPATNANPSTKGRWDPAVVGSWKMLTALRTALDSNSTVNDARTEAARIKLSAYSDTRGTDAITTVLAAMESAAANATATTSAGIQTEADAAGRLALVALVARSNLPMQTPTADYTAFITASDPRFTDFGELAPIVAAAAAAGATKENGSVLRTLGSLKAKAKEAIVAAIPSVYAAAARALRPELLLSGSFGPGVTGLQGTISLPANHPTNPFRHRRHPDHSTGFDITRKLTLSFDGAAGDSLQVAGFGVNSISGTFEEEISGLHKPLGPNQNIGLKVRGTFTLQRLSLIDALNAR